MKCNSSYLGWTDLGESEGSWVANFSNVSCAHTIHICKTILCIYVSFCFFFLLRNVQKWLSLLIFT